MLNECSGDIVVSNRLKLTEITKSFAGVRAFRGVSFDLGVGT
jgi:hypothetical protein